MIDYDIDSDDEIDELCADNLMNPDLLNSEIQSEQDEDATDSSFISKNDAQQIQRPTLIYNPLVIMAPQMDQYKIQIIDDSMVFPLRQKNGGEAIDTVKPRKKVKQESLLFFLKFLHGRRESISKMSKLLIAQSDDYDQHFARNKTNKYCI